MAFSFTGTGKGLFRIPDNLQVDGIAEFDNDVSLRYGAPVQVKRLKFSVANGGAAGTHTGSVPLPAGAILIDTIVHAVALWNSGTSATLKVGDAVDDDGIFTAVNLKATDLLAGESINFDRTGGKEGADLGGTATHWNRRYLSTARTITGVITLVGTTATTGETYIDVVFSAPSTADVTTATFA